MSSSELDFWGPLTSPKRWFYLRDQAVVAARENRACLMSGRWSLDKNDPTVQHSNRYWMGMAKRCHGIAMGRVPLFGSATFKRDGEAVSGAVFVRAA